MALRGLQKGSKSNYVSEIVLIFTILGLSQVKDLMLIRNQDLNNQNVVINNNNKKTQNLFSKTNFIRKTLFIAVFLRGSKACKTGACTVHKKCFSLFIKKVVDLDWPLQAYFIFETYFTC